MNEDQASGDFVWYNVVEGSLCGGGRYVPTVLRHTSSSSPILPSTSLSTPLTPFPALQKIIPPTLSTVLLGSRSTIKYLRSRYCGSTPVHLFHLLKYPDNCS